MNKLSKIVLGLISFLTALAAVLLIFSAYFLPKNIKIESTTLVEASPELVFPHLSHLKTWQAWAIWAELDPQIKTEVSINSANTLIGQSLAWSSTLFGSGRILIQDELTNSFLQYKILSEHWSRPAHSYFSISSSENSTALLWVTQFDLNIFERLYWHLFATQNNLRLQFQKSLENIKTLSEKK